MAGICLPPHIVQSFRDALTSGKITPERLQSMSSDERHALFSDVVGEGNAKFVNSQLESKLLLKNQQQGMLTWAKKMTGVTESARRDIISRIGRMDDRLLNPTEERAFLKDLASSKIGADVSSDEAKQIGKLSAQVKESETTMQSAVKTNGFTDATKDVRLKAGADKIAMQNYLDELKAAGSKKTLSQTLIDGLKPQNYLKNAKIIAGTAKGLVASFTSHAPLKHGFMALFEDPKDWARNYVSQFSDAAKQIGGKDVMSAIRTEGLSRENAINGIYDKWIPGELLKSNEEFHAGLTEKVPILGSRLYKASKTMFDGFNLKMRMDMVDHYVGIVKAMGFDPKDPEVAKAWGKLAIDQTGGKTTNPDNLLGNFLFSQRLIKSQANNLTMHLFDKSATKAVKVQSAKTLAKMVAGISAVIATANVISPGSVETDPRSANFGKIKVGDTRFDISGGMSSLVTLAGRIAARSSKSSSTGVVTPLGSGIGQTSFGELIGDFLSGRASPAGQIVSDYANDQTFTGKKPTVGTEAGTAFTPIPVSTYQSLKNDPNSANHLAVMIAQQLGLMSSTYGIQNKSQSSIDTSTSKSLLQFKQKVGQQTYEKAGQQYDQAYNQWLSKTKSDPRFKGMSSSEQQKQIEGEKSHLKKTILEKYGYKTVKGQKTSLLNAN